MTGTTSVADCYANAMVGSLFATLECEWFDRQPGGRFTSHQEAELVIFEDREVFSDTRRRHSALGQVPPAAFAGSAQSRRRALTGPPQAGVHGTGSTPDHPHGHAAGDVPLRGVARRLVSSCGAMPRWLIWVAMSSRCSAQECDPLACLSWRPTCAGHSPFLRSCREAYWERSGWASAQHAVPPRTTRPPLAAAGTIWTADDRCVHSVKAQRKRSAGDARASQALERRTRWKSWTTPTAASEGPCARRRDSAWTAAAAMPVPPGLIVVSGGLL